MMGDPDVPPCPWNPPSSSSAPDGDQARAPFLQQPVPGTPCPTKGSLWSRDKGKKRVSYSLGSQTRARDCCALPKSPGELLVPARGRGPCVLQTYPKPLRRSPTSNR